MGGSGVLGGASDWLVPRRVAMLAVPVSMGLLVPLLGAYLISGVGGTIAVTLGYTGCLVPALMLPGRTAAAMAVPIAMAGAVGVAVNGQAFAAACFAALSCLLVAPANVLSNGLLAGLPTVVAVAVAVPTPLAPGATCAWMLGSGLVAVLLVALLREPAPPQGIPAGVAWSHAVVMAAAVGLSVFVVAWAQSPRGLWVPMTMTVVLRPLAEETSRLARQRIAGTLAGALVAVGIVGLLPGWAAAAAGLALLVALVGYGMLDRYPQQVTVLTPLIILLGSSGTGGALGFALERVAYTALGVVLAAVIAVLLVRWNQRARS